MPHGVQQCRELALCFYYTACAEVSHICGLSNHFCAAVFCGHMNTPLLLITWRRPHTLRQVIDAIRPVAPTRLYVACDGPNPERLAKPRR